MFYIRDLLHQRGYTLDNIVCVCLHRAHRQREAYMCVKTLGSNTPHGPDVDDVETGPYWLATRRMMHPTEFRWKFNERLQVPSCFKP